MIGNGVAMVVTTCRESELHKARFEATLSGTPLAGMADDRPMPSTQPATLGIDAGVD